MRVDTFFPRGCWLGALEVARLAGKRSAVGTVVGTPIFCVGTVGTVMNDFKILTQ